MIMMVMNPTKIMKLDFLDWLDVPQNSALDYDFPFLFPSPFPSHYDNSEYAAR
jgi:hypothetical protein